MKGLCVMEETMLTNIENLHQHLRSYEKQLLKVNQQTRKSQTYRRESIEESEALNDRNEMICDALNITLNIQIAFSDLSASLQKKLLEIDFNILLSHDNSPDLVDFVEFIVEHNLDEDVSWMFSRFRNELYLFEAFVDRDKEQQYDCLPVREFKSYEKLLNY